MQSIPHKPGIKSLRQARKLGRRAGQLPAGHASPKPAELRFERFLKPILQLTGPLNEEIRELLRLLYHRRDLRLPDFSMFKCLEQCMLHTDLIKERTRRLVCARYGYLLHSEETVPQLMEHYGMSVEAVKQLTGVKVKLEQYFWDPICEFLQLLQSLEAWMPRMLFDYTDDVIFVDEQAYNEEHDTAFSHRFMARCIAMLSDRYIPLSSQFANGSVLVDRGLAAHIRLEALMNDLEARLANKRPGSGITNPAAYFEPYVHFDQASRTRRRRVQLALVHILKGLYGIELDEEGGIQIGKPSGNQSPDFLMQFLQKVAPGLHL